MHGFVEVCWLGLCMLITEAKSCQLIGAFPSYFPVFFAEPCTDQASNQS